MRYYNNERSDNYHTHARTHACTAYPLQNQTVKSIKSLTARLHGDITLPCVFTPGALFHRYSVHWFRGLTQLDTTNTMRYTVTRDFDLVISGVDALDASDAYYCVVDIENMLPRFTQGYHEIGPSIELIVTGEREGVWLVAMATT